MFSKDAKKKFEIINQKLIKARKNFEEFRCSLEGEDNRLPGNNERSTDIGKALSYYIHSKEKVLKNIGDEIQTELQKTRGITANLKESLKQVEDSQTSENKNETDQILNELSTISNRHLTEAERITDLIEKNINSDSENEYGLMKKANANAIKHIKQYDINKK
jgi:methylthioribose-1-phosphate isomerase